MDNMESMLSNAAAEEERTGLPVEITASSIAREDYDSDEEPDRSEGTRPSYRLDTTIPNLTRPPLRQYGNTGVKGVINDYKDEEKFLREQKKLKEQEEREQLASTIKNFTSETTEVSTEDCSLIETFRLQRLADMRKMVMSRFGKVEEVDPNTFVDIVDSTEGEVVIVSLFDPRVAGCEVLLFHLRAIAAKHPYVQFLQVNAQEAMPGFDTFALPALLVYSNGDIVKKFMRLTDTFEKGDDFELDDVEELLMDAGFLKSSW